VGIPQIGYKAGKTALSLIPLAATLGGTALAHKAWKNSKTYQSYK
jgi:hypothetical protein